MLKLLPFTNAKVKIDLENQKVYSYEKVLNPLNGTYDLSEFWGEHACAVSLTTIAYVTIYTPNLHPSKYGLINAVTDTGVLDAHAIYLTHAPIPSSHHVGFYHIPFYEGYVINRAGFVKEENGLKRNIKITSVVTGKIKKTPHWRVCLKSEYLNRFNTLGRYRALAYTFITPPSNTKLLEVNHIDGVSDNDTISNLEWCTPKRNAYHSVSTGLRDDVKAVDVLNVITKQFDTYFSIGEAGRITGVDYTTISSNVNSGVFRIFLSQYLFRLNTDSKTRPWPEITEEMFEEQSLPGVVAFNVFTRTETSHKTIKGELVNISGVPSRTISVRGQTGINKLPINGWLFYREYNKPDVWPTYTTIQLKYLQYCIDNKVLPQVGYLVTNIKNGHTKICHNHSDIMDHIDTWLPARDKMLSKPVNGFKIDDIF